MYQSSSTSSAQSPRFRSIASGSTSDTVENVVIQQVRELKSLGYKVVPTDKQYPKKLAYPDNGTRVYSETDFGHGKGIAVRTGKQSTEQLNSRVKQMPIDIAEAKVTWGGAVASSSELHGSFGMDDTRSTARINLENQQVNLKMEREQLEMQRDVILPKQREVAEMQFQMSKMELQAQRTTLGFDSQLLGIKREQFGLQKQQDQVDLRSTQLDLGIMKIRGKYAQEQSDLEYKQEQIQYGAQKRELGLEAKALPLQIESLMTGCLACGLNCSASRSSGRRRCRRSRRRI